MIKNLLVFGLIFSASIAVAQTALNSVPAYNADFGQGLNLGWYNNWTDAELGRLAMGGDGVSGAGANTIRPGLFSYFLEEYGYDIRSDEFELYARIGSDQQVVIIGYPNEAQRSDEYWCGERSELFKGLWEPVWNDANGTPYNEANAYAAYLYKAVQEYGNEVRFWEIWNEPDFSNSGNAWKDQRFEGNWFDNDIEPCELDIKAPVQAYVRMLRVSYEVIKRLQPDDYVAIGGIGSAGFLDAVLRTTDEKSNGATTAAHPYGGGAYFDALSFHVYPHIEGVMREWDNNTGDWAYNRHSDQAVQGVKNKLDWMESVLSNYGFNGTQYPRKVTLCTETGLPRRGYREEAAQECTPTMQRNFILKLLARAQQWGLAQIHPYQLAESEPDDEANDEFEVMGMYRFLEDVPTPQRAQHTQMGQAYRTYGQILNGAVYSEALTNAIPLPAGASGVGFNLPSGKTAYLLWAKTSQDGNEFPNTTFSVPQSWVGNFDVAAYDFATDQLKSTLGSVLSLSGTPQFVVEAGVLGGVSSNENVQSANTLSLSPNPTKGLLKLKLVDSAQTAQFSIVDMLGREVSSMKGITQADSPLEVVLDVSHLPNGTYTLLMNQGSDTVQQRFVKQ